MFWAIGLILLKMDIRLERNKEDRKMLTSEQIVELERQFNDYSFHRILNEKIDEKHGIKYKYYRLAEKVNKEK